MTRPIGPAAASAPPSVSAGISTKVPGSITGRPAAVPSPVSDEATPAAARPKAKTSRSTPPNPALDAPGAGA